MGNIKDQEVKDLINHIEQISRKTTLEMLSNVVFVYPATVIAVKNNGLQLDIKMLADDSVIENVENYNTRRVAVGMPCHIFNWGVHNRLNNPVVLFGGTQFR